MDVLKRIGVGPFTPLAYLKHPLAQTLAGTYFPQPSDLFPTCVHELVLPDLDRLIVIENRPFSFQPGGRVALLVHGLLGSHNSGYMRRITRKLVQSGVAVFRLNLRNSGPGFGLSKKTYHAGISEDARFVLRWLNENYPKSPVTQIGFSLGANLTLKLAGEDGIKTTGGLDSVIAVSPPLHLGQTAHRLSKSFFDSYFVKLLKRDVQRLHQILKTKTPCLDNVIRIRDFDQRYTAPVHGFKDAEEYYEQCSSAHYIPHIRVPTLILASLDDPIAETSEILRLPVRSGQDLIITEQGGHLGFVGFDKWHHGYRWMDRVVVNWVQQLTPTPQWISPQLRLNR